MTDMQTEEVVRTDVTEPGDSDKFAHYVPAHKLTDAMVFGTPLEALCGKKWIPTRDGLKFPICPECKEKWEALEEG